ncbi:MAG: VanW family protein [Syntrophomonadaceae bacterium]
MMVRNFRIQPLLRGLVVLLMGVVLAALPYRAQLHIQAHQATAVAADNVAIVGSYIQVGNQRLDIQSRPALFIDADCRDLIPDIMAIPEIRRPYIIVNAETPPDFLPPGLSFFWSPQTGTRSPALIWYDQKLIGYMYAAVEPQLYNMRYPMLVGEGEVANRTEDGGGQNAARAAQQISGTILAPGEIFSFYDHVTPSSKDGYVEGMTLFNTEEGPQWQPDLGGGICKTATALHFAVEQAGLEVLERHHHTEAVTYAESGQDTAVARSAGWDYQFRNSADKTIKIVAAQNGDKLEFRIYELLDPSGKVADR